MAASAPIVRRSQRPFPPVETFRRILAHRALLGVLVSREIKARYRGSALGWLWSFVNPLLLLGVYTVVFRYVFHRGATDALRPYWFFLFVGLLPWNWFHGTLVESTTALTGNANLLRKVLFPAELLTLTYVGSQFVHFLLALPVLLLAVVAAAVTGDRPLTATLALLPVLLVLQLVFVAGLALLLSPAAVHFRDVRDLIANVLQLLFFVTPILYSVDQVPVPLLREALSWNPVAPFFRTWQDLAFHGVFPPFSRWALLAALAAGAWLVGTWTFDRLRDGLVEGV